LRIITDKGESDIWPGQTFTIHAGTKHQFKALEETMVIEIMFVEYKDDDIERDSPGFIDKEIADNEPKF
jgi:quercetin dioxygenase-like cupin family protein